MNKYLVTIRIKEELVNTTVQAECSIHAQLIAEWHFGIGSVTNTPTKLAENTISPLQTSEQARVKALQAQVDRARQAVKAERARQTMAKAQRQMSNISE